MKLGYRHTLAASCIGYAVQAIINNYSPLLYVVYAEELGISLAKISLLITLNFVIQIGMDLSGAFLIDKMSYRASVIAANICAIAGLCSLGILPMIMSDKFSALMIATIISAIGGGLLEVVVSPIVEAMPKEAGFSMNFLHSFYCWGHAGVIILSTLFFSAFGIERWNILAVLWCILPLISGILFCFVPIETLKSEKNTRGSIGYLFGKKQFWLLMVVMLAAGASELGMAQWASYFAERGLGVPKMLGDILGPCTFAISMGLGRLLFGLFGSKLKIERWMTASFVLCIISYLMTALSPIPILSLLGCTICGASVALMWPGSYTLGAEILPRGGIAMFALFALAGDIGCSVGPSIVGLVSDGVATGDIALNFGSLFDATEAAGIRLGLIFTTLIPSAALVSCLALLKIKKHGNKL